MVTSENVINALVEVFGDGDYDDCSELFVSGESDNGDFTVDTARYSGKLEVALEYLADNLERSRYEFKACLLSKKQTVKVTLDGDLVYELNLTHAFNNDAILNLFNAINNHVILHSLEK